MPFPTPVAFRVSQRKLLEAVLEGHSPALEHLGRQLDTCGDEAIHTTGANAGRHEVADSVPSFVCIGLLKSENIVHADHVYLQRADERIKFSERALLALAPYLEEDGNGLILRIDGSGEVCPCNLVPLSFGNVNPRPSLDLLLSSFFVSDAPWNETGWNNEQVDGLVHEPDRESVAQLEQRNVRAGQGDAQLVRDVQETVQRRFRDRF